MDAYLFAECATDEATAAALAAVDDGTARAALPLIGARRLYVAVSDDDAAALFQKVALIAAIPGLVGLTAHSVIEPSTPQPKAYPTHGAVGDYVGFCLLVTLPGDTLSVYTAVQGIDGVVGAAMVTGEAVSVVVEVTADDTTTLATLQLTVRSTPGVVAAPTAMGVTVLGAGFTTA